MVQAPMFPPTPKHPALPNQAVHESMQVFCGGVLHWASAIHTLA